jgi:octopine/nopaline transport system permease protein
MSQTFAIFEVFTLAGIIYLLINLALVMMIRLLEGHLMRHEPR